jgi:hypothetical protein
MRKRIALIIMSILVLASVFVGSSQAGGDNNTYNNGENENYEDNNNNDFSDDEFPGSSDQKRGGVVW